MSVWEKQKNMNMTNLQNMRIVFTYPLNNIEESIRYNVLLLSTNYNEFSQCSNFIKSLDTFYSLTLQFFLTYSTNF